MTITSSSGAEDGGAVASSIDDVHAPATNSARIEIFTLAVVAGPPRALQPGRHGGRILLGSERRQDRRALLVRRGAWQGEVSSVLYQTGEKPAHLHVAFKAENRRQVEVIARRWRQLARTMGL